MTEKNCFVVGPIGEKGSQIRKDADFIFTLVISPSVTECGYKAVRADKISEPGLITNQIIQFLMDSPLVVVDLTGRNPNVFYELALCHALRKPLIQVIKKGEVLPFDVSGIRTIEIDPADVDSIEAAKLDIADQIRAIEQGTNEIQTPFTVALNLKILKGSENVERQSLAGIVETVTEMKKSLLAIEETTERKGDAERGVRDSLIKQVSSFIETVPKQIAEVMKKDARWAADIVENVKLGYRPRTLFGQRLDHFRDEKEHIAERFLPLLLRHCHALVSGGKKVYLIMDSGTTLYPFFQKIGEQAIQSLENSDDWFGELFVVTNNLAGIETLMEYGRINPNYRYSPLAVNCHLLPGIPLPIYSAITGRETNEALLRLRAEETKKRECVFIGLVTGNWVRMRRTHPVCPVPLARGLGHLEFKQTVIDVSDEIFVIAPLGKLFVNISEEEVNGALGYVDTNRDPDKLPYKHVRIDNQKASAVKLISTTRLEGRVLSKHSMQVSEVFQGQAIDPVQFPVSSDKIDRHILFTFDKLPINWFEQIDIEFPHAYSRRQREFMGKYFAVPRAPLKDQK